MEILQTEKGPRGLRALLGNIFSQQTFSSKKKNSICFIDSQLISGWCILSIGNEMTSANPDQSSHLAKQANRQAHFMAVKTKTRKLPS